MTGIDQRAERKIPEPGERPHQDDGVSVLNPRGLVPVCLDIDDSTCLVNLTHFALPQFAAARVDGRTFRQPWREMPREIPDDFVRRFGEWCGENGVKGKYSIVPYPACVGRIDRILPGWTAQELEDSLELVRSVMMPNWDIHPEMVTHTRVIDLKTGHPYEERSPRYQENWDWSVGRSADELAEYMAYALRILRNVGLDCEGITTPGGFGNRVLPELALATLQSCRDVFQAEIPHYFRHIYSEGDRSVAPRVELASGLGGTDPRCVVSIVCCTGDWTGGWDCSEPGDVDRFITSDLEGGRVVEVIDRGEPAAMICHWQGMYYNGQEVGFRVFQEVVRRLHARYDNLIWMKNSEIARYWAARELTTIRRNGSRIELAAPFACPDFTLRVEGAEVAMRRPRLCDPAGELTEVNGLRQLRAGKWVRGEDGITVCLDLPKGSSAAELF